MVLAGEIAKEQVSALKKIFIGLPENAEPRV